MKDFNALLRKASKSAEEAGLKPSDVERAIREVRSKK
jgi:hypothetical protein